MNILRLDNNSLQKDSYSVYLNGVLCSSNELSVPDKFHIKFVQDRVLFASSTIMQKAMQKLVSLFIGNRKTWGMDYSNTGWAVWEADCEINRNSVISTKLVNTVDFVGFNIESAKVDFFNVCSIHGSLTKIILSWFRRFISILPLILLFSGIPLFMIYMMVRYGPTEGIFIDSSFFIYAVFIGMPIFAIYSSFRFFYDASNNNSFKTDAAELKRIKRITMILNISTLVFGLVTTLGAILKFSGIASTAFAVLPCTVLFILIMWSASTVSDKLPYANDEVRTFESAFCNAKSRMFIAFASVFLLIFIPS